MMLVQKPPALSLNTSPATLHHRRHPSAPPAVVVVQPTRTPGLLSIAKPQQQRQQPQQRSPRPPQAQRSSPKLHVAVGAAPATPLPPPRGRQSKDKPAANQRSNSLSGRRQAHRQPSPPSQAEGPTTPTKSTRISTSNSDPFIVSVPSPTLSTRPSGKLARRRQPQPPLTQPVSIPSTTNKQPSKPVSRSVPLPRHRPAKRSVNLNSSTTNTTAANPSLLPPFDFPICDDMTEGGDISDAEPSPVTPTRPRAPRHTHSKPPAFVPPAVVNKHGRPGRNHKRAPSDSGMVFHMSSDESGPENSSNSEEELRALVRNMALARTGMRTPPPAQRERMYEAQAQAQLQGYFASSVFQNSPSPEELPDPLFV
ncbi:hypothetical protein LshimejAT787_1102410 [Lyophyllum shimeji]|uniref:Uncharacterized protein n=1 Tax=Lyophyllum shimeji TaxID=47721 RepID=A0A9P3PVZ9_LYOSH|nr:hypothetical protein LshimejAT787_1102410 [Lyophyllum shimeji]